LQLKDWLLYLYATVAPLYSFAIFFGRDTPGLWVIVLMVFLLIYEFVRSGGSFIFDRSFLYLLLLLAVYAAMTLHIFMEEPGGSLLGRTPLQRAVAIDLRLLNVVVAFIVFVHFLADAPMRVFENVLRIQLIVGAILGLFGVLQYVMFVFFHSTALTAIEPTNEAFALRSNIFTLARAQVFRAPAIFSEPSFFGFFLIPVTVKAVVAWGQQSFVGSRFLHGILIAIFMFAIIANFSLTAVLSIFGMLVILAVFLIRRSPRKALALLLLVVIFAGVVSVSPIGTAMLERAEQVFALRDLSLLDRMLRVYTGTLVFLDHPFSGVGPGGYAFWYPRMGGIDQNLMATPLNVWISFLTDVGIIGILPLLFFLWNVLRRGIQYSGRNILVPVYLWSVVSYLVLMTTLDFWFLELFWFEVAILLALTAGWNLRKGRAMGLAHASS
jgi:O-antigen ligase